MKSDAKIQYNAKNRDYNTNATFMALGDNCN